MKCPNEECGAVVDEGAPVCPQCRADLGVSAPSGPGGTAQGSQSGSTGKLANWSLLLGIVAFALPWAGAAALSAWGVGAEWRPPFVGTLIPVSRVPFEAAQLLSLLVALAAIVMGHLAISRGGGRRWPLAAAVVVYPVAGGIVLFLGPVVHTLSRFIPFYQGLVLFALFVAPTAFVVMHLVTGFRRVRKTGGVIWRPVLGAMLGYFNIALVSLCMISLFGKVSTNLDMGACAGNLRQLEKGLEKYSTANHGAFPPLSAQPGVLMFLPEAIQPNDDMGSLLTCPTIRYARKPTTGPASPFDDQSYFYLGYALRNDAAVEAFAKAYREQIARGGNFDQDLVVEDAGGIHTIHRLATNSKEVLRASQDPLCVSPYEGQSPGYQTPCVTDDVPILIERDIRHRNIDVVEGPSFEGAWVLFLHDGVQFVERGTWPITEKTQRILAELSQ